MLVAILNHCQLLSRLHSADEDVVSWLTDYGLWHAYDKKKKKYLL